MLKEDGKQRYCVDVMETSNMRFDLKGKKKGKVSGPAIIFLNCLHPNKKY